MLYRKLRVTNTLLGQKNQALQSLSGIDPLTSLFNRRHFQDCIDAEPLAGDRRRQGMGAEVQGVLLIDLDHFKSINDRHGHAAGDVVLVAMSERLRLALREEDMIVRWGGEEFLVFVPAVSIGRLDDIARRIMDTISSQPVMHRGASLRVTASIGYAPMPLPPARDFPLTWERALALVDKALYMAKLHWPQSRLRRWRAACAGARSTRRRPRRSRGGMEGRRGRHARADQRPAPRVDGAAARTSTSPPEFERAIAC